MLTSEQVLSTAPREGSRTEESSYFGLVGAVQAVFVESDLLLVLGSHLNQSFCQFIFILLLPPGVDLHEPGLVALPGLLHLLHTITTAPRHKHSTAGLVMVLSEATNNTSKLRENVHPFKHALG